MHFIKQQQILLHLNPKLIGIVYMSPKFLIIRLPLFLFHLIFNNLEILPHPSNDMMEPLALFYHI